MAQTYLKSFTGAVPKDGNGTPINDAQTASFQDATATPQISPIATVTTVKTIVVPSFAIKFVVRPRGANMRIGNNATLTGSGDGHGYFFVYDGESFEYPCADGGNIYFASDSGTITAVDFMFSGL